MLQNNFASLIRSVPDWAKLEKAGLGRTRPSTRGDFDDHPE